MKKSNKEWRLYPTEDNFKTEEQLSRACFDWFDKTFKAEFRGILYLNFNNPKDARQGNTLVAQGLRKGSPDFTLAIPLFSKGIASLYIELKMDKGVVSEAQKKQHKVLEKFGHKVIIICSLRHFQEAVTQWVILFRKEA